MRVLSIMIVVALLVCLFVSGVVSQGGGGCPPAKGEVDSKLEEYLDKNQGEIQDAQDKYLKNESKSPSFQVSNLGQKCLDGPDPDDGQGHEGKSRRKRSHPACKPKFEVNTCDPCYSTQHYLWKFYNCIVIWPWFANVRYVTCPSSPFHHMCSHKNHKCHRSHWNRVWFWSYCWNKFVPAGYHNGFNYNYLWLPQECSCKTC